MAAICGEGKIFLKIAKSTFLDTPWSENFNEIALSRTVKEIEANLCFATVGKNSKIQNGCHFWGGENFLKIAKITFLRYPVAVFTLKKNMEVVRRTFYSENVKVQAKTNKSKVYLFIV